ncbi:hypothetical protein Trydic_g3222 [Trypoxylus dichotomus]
MLMVWRLQGSDLFPISLLWNNLYMGGKERQTQSAQQLWCYLQEALHQMDTDYAKASVNNMPRISKAVIRINKNGVDNKITPVVVTILFTVPTEKDSYGNEVSRLARPLPVEYLLLDVPASTPLTPTYTFNNNTTKQPFPIENRLVDGHIQDFNALSTYLAQFSPNEFLTAISDFHLLLYIATMDMLPMREYMGPLLEAIRYKNAEAAQEWCRSEHWATVEQLIAASSPPPSRPGSVAGGSISVGTGSQNEAQWTCPYYQCSIEIYCVVNSRKLKEEEENL